MTASNTSSHHHGASCLLLFCHDVFTRQSKHTNRIAMSMRRPPQRQGELSPSTRLTGASARYAEKERHQSLTSSGAWRVALLFGALIIGGLCYSFLPSLDSESAPGQVHSNIRKRSSENKNDDQCKCKNDGPCNAASSLKKKQKNCTL